MKRSLSKYLLGFLAIVLLFLTGTAAWVWMHRDKLTGYVVTALNEHIKSKVEVHDINLSFFHQFPNVSLDFNDVRVSEPGADKNTLLRAQHVFISFNLYDILTDQYHIRDIAIDSGYCNLYTDKQGKQNYLVFDNKSDSASLLFKLKQVHLSKLTYQWNDDLRHQHYSGCFTQADFSLEKNQRGYLMKGKLASIDTRIKSNQIRLLKNKHLTLDLDLQIDLEANEINLSSATLTLGELPFKITGLYRFNENPFISMKASAPEATLNQLLSVMPFSLPDVIKDYKSSGQILCTANIEGPISTNKQPKYTLEFKIHQGTLVEPQTGITISSIECKGSFSNKSSGHPILIIQPFQAKTEGGSFQGNLTLDFQKNTHVLFDCQGKLPIRSLFQFIPDHDWQVKSGMLEGHVRMNGNVEDFYSKKALSSISDGQIHLQLEELTKETKSIFKTVDLSADLKGGDMVISHCAVSTASSDVGIQGAFEHVVPWIFNRSPMIINVSGASKSLHAEDLMWSNAAETARFELPEDIELYMNFSVQQFQYHLFEAAKVKGQLAMNGNRLNLQNFSCSSMGGQLNISGQSEPAKNGMRLINAKGDLRGINIKELFRQCGDFGQEEITYQHLNGTLNGQIELVSIWDRNWTCITDKLFATSDLQILDGEINGYKPLESLSKYADVAELRSLRFAELKNQISISNQTIVIPDMEVTNNALNITLGGTHSFDQMVDYRFKVKLKELLAGNRKKSTNEYGEEEENGSGLYLYLTMKGPMSNPKISYDKVAVKNKVKTDILKEKESMKELFRKEFGIGKDTLIKEKETNDDNIEFEKD